MSTHNFDPLMDEAIARPSLDLDAMEARANAATPGPWEVADYNKNHENPESDTWLGVIWGAFEIVDEQFQIGRVKYSSLPRSENYANAEFIAHCRTDNPALVAEVKRLREALADFSGAEL